MNRRIDHRYGIAAVVAAVLIGMILGASIRGTIDDTRDLKQRGRESATRSSSPCDGVPVPHDKICVPTSSVSSLSNWEHP